MSDPLHLFYFYSSDRSFQPFVRAELYSFQFHFRILAGSICGDFLSGCQRRVEITDAIQVHLSAFSQFFSHYLRESVQYGSHVYFVQCATRLYSTSEFFRIYLPVGDDARMESFLLGLGPVIPDSRTSQII